MERSSSKLWRKKWFPWAVMVLLVLIIAGLTAFLSSAWSRQRAMQQELQLQRETIEALRAGETKKDEEGLIHDGTPVITASLVCDRLKTLQELVTTEYIYTNSGKYENQNQATIIGKDFSIPFTSKRFIVAYDGRIKVGTDLSRAEASVNEATRTITITLPSSEITSHETFEDTLVVLDETNNVFNPISISDYNEFVSGQKADMEQKAIDRGVLSSADETAELIVRSYLSLLPEMDDYTLIIR